MTGESIGIVGGGLLGLTLADRLERQGNSVTVYEAAREFGGLASAWQLGNVVWDRFYHVILLSDLHTQGLLKQLGLEDEFVGVETKTGFYTDGQLYSMSNSLEFLRFPPLGLWSKFRLGWTIFWASKIKNWRQLEAIPVETWLRKWSGQKTFEKIWLPLLRAKLGESYRDASAAFIWATIARMYAARRSGMKRELFGYVRGGYAKIIERFVQQLRHQGVTLQAATPIQSVKNSTDGRPTVNFSDGTHQEFDRVFCTAAPPIAKRLIPQLTLTEQQQLENVKYHGIVCASVLLRKPLAKFYVTNITEPWVPFTAVIEMTALVDPAEFQGQHLVYLPKYVAPDDPLFQESDDSIRERFVSALQRMYPALDRDDVLAFQVARVKHVFAVPTLHYSANVPSMKTSLPGVYMVNSSQIINGTLNVNETLQLAENALKQLDSSEESLRKPTRQFASVS